MRVAEWLDLHKRLCDEARALSEKKGHDYSGTADTLANLKTCEAIGLCRAEIGILVRLTDKFKRLAVLIGSGEAPQNEPIHDTILDVLNYTLLLAAVLEEQAATPCPKP